MEPDELIADLDKELRSVLAALQNFAPVTEDVTVSDPTDSVQVTVRPDASLAAVTIAPAWSEKIDAQALAGVIGEVVGRAQARAMGFDIDRLEALEEGTELPDVEVDEAAVEAQRAKILRDAENTLLAPSTQEELQRRIDELPGTIDAAMARMDKEIERMQNLTDADLPRDPAEFTPDEDYGDFVHSENRMVSVRLVAGLVADVRLHENWVARRSGNVLTECFTQIIDQLPEVVAAQNRQGDH